jgi:plasmid stabilization system protein ParE
MRVFFSPRARADLAELLAYVAQQDPKAADAMAAAIDAAVDRCAMWPRLGSLTTRRQVYRLPVRRHGVTLFYRVRPRKKEIEFIRVVRGQRVKSLGEAPR